MHIQLVTSVREVTSWREVTVCAAFLRRVSSQPLSSTRNGYFAGIGDGSVVASALMIHANIARTSTLFGYA
jgi:hypothetical protein